MKLNRELQHKLLETLAQSAPNWVDHFKHPEAGINFKDRATTVNLMYLHEHGLIDLDFAVSHSGEHHLSRARINNRGQDFLAEDGGLSAILGVQVVKLHTDTIRELLMAKIASEAPSEALGNQGKDKLLAAVKAASGRTIERLLNEAIDRGISQAPDAMLWISRFLEAAA